MLQEHQLNAGECSPYANGAVCISWRSFDLLLQLVVVEAIS